MTIRREEVRITADISNFTTKMAEAGVAAKGFADELDKSNNDMGLLLQSTLALGPALVPLGGVATAAVAGLASQLGFAAIGAGTAMLALHGLGDAMQALSTYQAAPTAQNLAKVNAEFNKLAPAAQKFLLEVDGLQQKLGAVKAVAQQGLFTGLNSGINDLLASLPQVKDLVAGVSLTLGRAAADGVKALKDPEWQAFFNYLQQAAPQALSVMAQGLGNVAKGLAGIFQAVDPLSHDVSTALLHMSEAFASWGQNLGQSKSFQAFLDYVHSQGPVVAQTLEAVANALVSVLHAAQPFGGPVLDVVRVLADSLSAIANSPAGPAIIGAASAMILLSKAVEGLKFVGFLNPGEGNSNALNSFVTVQKSNLTGMVTAIRSLSAARQELEAAQQAAGVQKGLLITQQFGPIGSQFLQDPKVADDYVLARKAEEEATQKVAAAETERSRALNAGMGTIGRATALVGGLAVAQSGLADKIGLSHTASLAMMGTIAGPWGAAIGAGVGLVQDFAQANDNLEAAISAANRAATDAPLDLTARQKALDQLIATQKDYQAQITHARSGVAGQFDLFSPETWGNLHDQITSVSDLFSHASTQGAQAIAQQQRSLDQVKAGLQQLSLATSGTPLKSLDQFQTFATQIGPALAAAGLQLKGTLDPSQLNAYISAIESYTRTASTVPGETQAVANAFANISNSAQTASQKTALLDSALQALFNPALNKDQALTQYKRDIESLTAELTKNGNTLDVNTKAGQANHDAIRQRVTDLLGLIKAEVDNGASQTKVTDTLVQGRKAIEAAAEAAGISKKAVDALLHSFNLTPKLLKTIFDAETQAAEQKARQLQSIYAHIPRRIVTQAITQHQNKFDHTTGNTSGFAGGGPISGPGTATSDSIPAWLSDGEYVVKAAAVAKYGVHMFDRLNAMAYANGGPVVSVPARGYAAGGAVAGGGSIDYRQLANALAQVRPLYGDVHLQPHNYNEFTRQMHADKIRAGGGGVNF